MAKHTLFLVHGMGRHEGTAWSDEVWKKLVECSERYRHFRETKALAEYADPVPVGYDGFICGALARWKAQATGFGEFAQANTLRHGDRLDWLAGMSGDDDGFVMGHLADVIIYRFFRHESAHIRANVQLKIFEEIERKRGQDAEAKFSLMAYSLGTAVAHDALAEMGDAPVIGRHVNTFGTRNFRFHSIHMLANLSRLLQTSSKAYESVVRPGARDTKHRYCGEMYCYRHELDPIAKPRAFDPISWGADFEMANVNHYRGWNVHGWLHYLDNPRVHIPLLKSITKASAIKPSMAGAAMNSYPQFGDELENLATAQDRIAELHALAQGIDAEQGLRKNFDALRKMWGGVKDLKDLAGSTWTSLEGVVS